MKLWYNAPAKRWIDCLPLGNGNLGFMMDGGVKAEHIYLNDDTLWSGYPKSHLNGESAENLSEIRRLIFAGENDKADALIKRTSLGDWCESYEPLGKITLKYNGVSETSNYNRELNLSDAVHTSKFGSFIKEAFCSYPDKIGVIKIKSSQPFNVKISISSRLKSETKCSANGLILLGNAPDTAMPNYCRTELYPVRYNEHKAMAFCAGIKPVTNGRIVDKKHSMIIKNATNIELYIFTKTGFIGFDKMPITDRTILESEIERRLKQHYSFDEIKKRHIADYKSLYDRVRFNINGNTEIPSGDELIKMAKNGTIHSALPVLYYQYARYMTITGSRAGTQALNLQGIWNNQVRPPWSSNYTNNINAQMNYWFTAGTNLRECLEPYESYIKEITFKGEECAKVNYNCRGMAVNHNADIWRKATPVKDDPVYAYFPLAGVWLVNELYSHSLYENDNEKLSRIFPILQKSVLFCLDWLIEHKGYLVTCPSASPELHFKKNGKSCTQDYATAFDMGIVKQAFEDYLKAADILKCSDYTDDVKIALSKLQPYGIGKSGKLLEWSDEYAPAEKGHRHFSPLYAVYPGNTIIQNDNWNLINAARKLLDERMNNGSGQTGWSAAWAACLYARFKDREQAYSCLEKLWIKSTHNNLFDKHPPYYFQIDGNFGGAAAIQEMLVQQNDDAVYILPALPDQWSSGSMNGLILHGGMEFSVSWKNNALCEMSFISPNDKEISAIYKNKQLKIQLNKNEKVIIKGERFI